MIRTFLAFCFFSVCAFSFGVPDTHAATLYFDPSAVNIHHGDSVVVDLRIDTDEGECVNTFDALIHYDESIIAVDISRGNSILNIWVEDPTIDEVNRTIHFAGGVPGGYCGRIAGDPSLTNVILQIVFKSPGLSIGGANTNKTPHVWLDEVSQVLLHDGYGTPAPLTLRDAIITLDDTVGQSIQDAWRESVQSDTELPSDFAITLTKDDYAFSGEYFIVFNASDKQSGIDHYEVMEEPFSEFNAFKWGRADAPWVQTESPYVLKDQTLNSTIRVKALDKAGNVRIVTLVPDTALRSISSDMLILISVLGGVLLCIVVLVFFVLWKRKKRLEGNENSKEQ